VVQEAFLRVIRGSKRFDGQCAFYTWFYRIVFNLSVDFRRRVIPQRVRFEDQTPLSVEVSAGALSNQRTLDPFEVCANREACRTVVRVLETLSEPQHETLVSRVVYGMSYSEMAQAQGCSKGAVMSRLFHARQRIARALCSPSVNALEELRPSLIRVSISPK
jgi:RNA polymerase sigma-70 factor (ECF subfamily)